MKKYLLTAGLLLSSLVSSHALLLTFDSGPLTSGTGAPLSSSFTFTYGFLEDQAVDGNGDLIAPFYTTDPMASPVTAYTAAEINTLGYGPATTAALGAYDQLVLLTFTTPVNLNGFSVDLDNSTFGDFNRSILFIDEVEGQLASLEVFQTVAGGTYTLNTPLAGVKKILLPTTAFFDNLLLVPGAAAIPEPSLTLLAGAAALALGLRRRRAGS